MISVVISTLNDATTLEECLSSLFAAGDHNGLEVVVVDAYSRDGTREIAGRYPVTLYSSGGGISVQRNIGWRMARGDLILSLDADAYVEPGCLAEMERGFADPKVGIVECYPRAVARTWLSRAQGQLWDADFPHYRAIPVRSKGGGPVVMYRRDMMEDVGGFNEEHTYGAEDICLSHRAFSRGWRIALIDDRPAFHHPRHTLKGLIKQQFGWGRGLSILLENDADVYRGHPLGRYTPLIARLAGPLLAVKWAVVLRNPSFLLFYPLMQYSYIGGYIYGRAKGRGEDSHG